MEFDLKVGIMGLHLLFFGKTIYCDISNDGETWTTIFQKNDIPKQTELDVWAITEEFKKPVKTRYIRFSHLTDDGKWGAPL